MWSRSTGVMLSQNWRTWLKWSSYDAGALRVFAPGDRDRRLDERTVVRARVERAPAVQRVRPVRRDATVDGVLVEAVAEHVVDRCVRPVDRDLVEVRPAQAGELGVDVGEQPGLQQRVVGDVDARHQVADVEGDLLGLGEVVGGVARSASSGRSAAPARPPPARSWSGRAGRCPGRSAPGCPRRPGRPAPTGETRRTRWRRRGRGGGSRGPDRPASAPPPRPGSARRARASSGT